MTNLSEHTGAESPQGGPAPFGILSAAGWFATGLFVGLVALVAAAGTWSSAFWAMGVGAALAATLAAATVGIEYRQPTPVLIGVVCAVLGSAITVAWFAPQIRATTLSAAGQWIPENALKKAYTDPSDAVALNSCKRMLERGGTLSLRLHESLAPRPAVAAECLSGMTSDAAVNVRRRLGHLWLDALMNRPDVESCQLVEAYRAIAPPERSGQRLLSLRLSAASPSIQQCASDLLLPVLSGSNAEIIKVLKKPDALRPDDRVSLFTGLARTLYAPDNENSRMKDNELLRGWNVQLGCSALESDRPEVVERLNSVARAEECGFVPESQAAGIWWRVCYDLRGVGLRDVLDKSCEYISEIARNQAFSLARSTVDAALNARQQGLLSRDIDAGRDLNERLSQYENRLGAEHMKAMLENSNMPPLLRNQVMADLSAAQRAARSFEIERIKGLKTPDDAEQMSKDNMSRSLQIFKAQGLELEKELKARGVDEEVIESKEFQELLGEAQESDEGEEGQE